MFVTLDVVFHEDSMYFSSEPKLQGEYQEEVQTLDYEVEEDQILEFPKHVNHDVGNLDTSGINLDASGDEHSQLGSTNQEVGELDLSGIPLDQSDEIHPETEVVAPSSFESLTPQATNTPNQSFAEDVLEPVRKQLPQRKTRGIPKPTYEPDLSSKVKYPMSHYVSNHHLS